MIFEIISREDITGETLERLFEQENLYVVKSRQKELWVMKDKRIAYIQCKPEDGLIFMFSFVECKKNIPWEEIRAVTNEFNFTISFGCYFAMPNDHKVSCSFYLGVAPAILASNLLSNCIGFFDAVSVVENELDKRGILKNDKN
jgi:hypothetical protein